MDTELQKRMKVAAIQLPDSDRYLAGDYMRENPMYSAREVRDLIAAERKACAKVLRDKHDELAGRSYPPPKILLELEALILERSNVEHNRRPQGVRVDGPVGPQCPQQRKER